MSRHSAGCNSSPHDYGSTRLDVADVLQLTGSTDSIFNIANAPASAYLEHVFSAVSGPAAVVDKQHCVAPSGEELCIWAPARLHLASRSPVDQHNERRFVTALKPVVVRLVIKPMRLFAASCSPSYRFA